MSIVTMSSWRLRSGPSSSKKAPSVFCERPSAIQTGAPVRWLAITVRYLWLSFAKTPSRDWTVGKRRASHKANAPRTRSVGRPARGAQNPHRPHAREPGAPTAARPAQPLFETTAIRGSRSCLLGVALQPVVWMASGALPRTPGDRDSLAPAGLPRFLELEVPPRAIRSTAGRQGDCGSRPHDGARESTLGRAAHSRRAAQARPRRLAAERCPTHAALPETTLADLAHVPPEP